MSEKIQVYCAFVSNERVLTSDLIFFATAAQAMLHATQKTWSIQGNIDVRKFTAIGPSDDVKEKLDSTEGVEYGLLFFSLADLIATAPNFQISLTIPDGEGDLGQT